MRRAASLLIGTALAIAAGVYPGAMARRTIPPLAIQGIWLGQAGAMPADCRGDGYWIGFNSYDGQTFLMGVSQRVNGVLPPQDQAKGTDLKIVPAPAGAPDRIDLFLAGQGTEIGILIRTGSAMELIPAGPGKTYAATSLYLMRCG